MDVKEYLCRYHVTKEKILKLQALVDEYIRLANSIPGINFDQIRVDGGKNLQAPFEKWILKALDYELEIIEMTRSLPMIKEQAFKAIEQINDSELERLLVLRYIDWLTWNQIAHEMHISNATVRRRHAQAIEKIRLSRGEQG